MEFEKSTNRGEFVVAVGQVLQPQEAGGRASYCSAQQQQIPECLLRLIDAGLAKKVCAIGKVKATAKTRADIFMK